MTINTLAATGLTQQPYRLRYFHPRTGKTKASTQATSQKMDTGPKSYTPSAENPSMRKPLATDCKPEAA